MDRIDPFFVSCGVLRGRAYAREELAMTAKTQAERYEHQRMATLYEQAIEDAVARKAVTSHDQRTRFALAGELAPLPNARGGGHDGTILLTG